MPVDPSTPTLSRTRLRLAALMLLLLAATLVVIGILSRANAEAELKAATEAQAIPTVAVLLPIKSKQASEIELPGRLEAHARAPIHARVAGYLKSWKVDIGSEVKAGQLLAEIETPELDQQLLQARADLASAQANATMAEKSARRWQAMVGSDAVSQQEADEKSNDLMVKQSVVKALQANVERMEVLKGFARIQAPFAGTVTARSTDVGALINPGSSGGAELFVIADTRRLRLYVSVPQNQTAKIGPGTDAQVTVPERPGKRYPAKVEASAQAVQAASGTVLMQLSVDNSAGELLPGSYARVSLALPQAAEGLNIPVSALLFDKSGLRVATVDAENRVRLKTVTLLRDLGKSIDIGTGLTASDRVIESPPDGINEGDPVQIAAPESKSPAEGKPATDGKRDAGKG